MKHPIDLVEDTATVAGALGTMSHVETRGLIVDKRLEDDEYGMVLVSEIARAVLARNRAPERANISGITTRPVISADLRMDVRDTPRTFGHSDLSRAPVVDGGRATDIAGMTDLAIKGLAKH